MSGWCDKFLHSRHKVSYYKSPDRKFLRKLLDGMRLENCGAVLTGRFYSSLGFFGSGVVSAGCSSLS